LLGSHFTHLLLTGFRDSETQSFLETHSANPVLHHGPIEVQDQSDLQTSYSKVSKHLSEKNRIEAFHAFDFDDNFIADYQVGPVLRDEFTFVEKGNADLLDERQSGRSQFDAQSRLVNGLE
jgi:hypothetical protein